MKCINDILVILRISILIGIVFVSNNQLNAQCTDPLKYEPNCDFDGDGYNNDVDDDDDNDGILDEDECGDFMFLNAPGGSTTNTVTVCYNNSGAYSINGSTAQSIDDKLLNLSNFGPTGTYHVAFNVIEFDGGGGSNIPITQANLTAQGCDIFHAGGSNADGGSGNTFTGLTSGEKTELLAWSSASPSNIVLGFQGLVVDWNSNYVGQNGTNNPTGPTLEGRGIFAGPFGSVSGFSQAGGYQGTFNLTSASSSEYCVIMQDQSGGHVGFVDVATQDIFMADFGLFGTNGGLTNGSGISNSSANDKMLGNLYGFMAQFILEGETDMCQYLAECTDDFDNDGIVNVFDLDSDQDNCEDVFEGTAGFSSSQASNGMLIGAVDANGIPLLAGASGQGIGDGQNALIFDACGVDLRIEVDELTQSANKGEYLEYVFTIHNDSSENAEDVFTRINIPSNVDFIVAMASQGSYSNLTKLWNVGLLQPGSQTLNLKVKVK